MNDDDRTHIPGPEPVEFEFSIEFECPPRDIRQLIGVGGSVDISDESGLMDGEYRPCDYCDGDSLVEVGHYETHLREQHNLEP